MTEEPEPVAEKGIAPVIDQVQEPATEPSPALVIEPELELIIEQIKRRIREHESLLSQNRKRTELALIHPILEFMEWDTSDPELVIPAYRGEDYALVRNSRIKAILAAQPLNSKIFKAAKRVNFCKDNYIPYLIETDGDIWKMRNAILTQREIINVKLTRQPTPEAAASLYRMFDAIDGTIS